MSVVSEYFWSTLVYRTPSSVCVETETRRGQPRGEGFRRDHDRRYPMWHLRHWCLLISDSVWVWLHVLVDAWSMHPQQEDGTIEPKISARFTAYTPYRFYTRHVSNPRLPSLHRFKPIFKHPPTTSTWSHSTFLTPSSSPSSFSPCCRCLVCMYVKVLRKCYMSVAITILRLNSP